MEAAIVINGERMTIAHAMTVRVAVEHFATMLTEHEWRDNSPNARKIRAGYLEAIEDIRRVQSLVHPSPPEWVDRHAKKCSEQLMATLLEHGLHGERGAVLAQLKGAIVEAMMWVMKG